MQTNYVKALEKHFKLWLLVCRDGMVMMLPLTFIRVVVTVTLNLPWDGLPESWVPDLNVPWHLVASKLDTTLGVIMGLGLALCIGNQLHVALQRMENSRLTPMLVNLLCLVNFSVGMLIVNGSLENSLGQSLFLGMLTGIITVELLHARIRLVPKALRVVGVDGSMLFRHSFHQLLPAAFTCIVATLVLALVSQLGGYFSQGLQMLLATDALRLGGAYVLNLLLIVVNQMLWFVGLHGGVLVSAYASDLMAQPGVLFDATLASSHFINAFAYMGGCGATFGLVLAIMLVCKDQPLRRLGKYSVVPAVFNVNEILIFGLPMIFSPIMAVPFVLAPLVSASIAMSAYGMGWLEFSGHEVTWSTPILISGYVLSGGFSGVIVQIAGLFASTVLYMPFILRLQAQRQKAQSEALAKAMAQLCQVELEYHSVLRRPDPLGDFARTLHADFRMALGTPQVFQVYQPKHDIHGKVCGVEALLRWAHPVHGAIMPAAIVNVAEESRLIHQIGNWSLETACATLQQWKRQGVRGVCMSVNLSPMQLDDTAYVALVQQCLERFDLSPSELELEVTEGRTLALTKQADAMLRALCDLGVHLSMDDFGMGFSSLMYMQRFAMSAIKIDGCLTRDVVTNTVSADIIRAIVILGKKQGVRVVAEYVETSAQRDKLAELGCDEFQGYLYSPGIRSQAFLSYWHQYDQRPGRFDPIPQVAHH
jgi:lactose/cellobiose-specific phosphotransferase system IIC component